MAASPVSRAAIFVTKKSRIYFLSIFLFQRGSSRNQYSPVIRQMPQLALGVPRFRLCTFRPPKVCWRGDACTFAHSDAELALWNRQKIDGKRLYSWNQGITNGEMDYSFPCAVFASCECSATGNRVQYDSEQRLSQQVQVWLCVSDLLYYICCYGSRIM